MGHEQCDDAEAVFKGTMAELAQVFEEDGAFCALTPDGHQWRWCEGETVQYEWVRFTDDDDWYVEELAAA